MKPRTTVYVAMNGLVKVADGINYRQERVTLASDPAVAKYPDAWRELGTVDDDGAAYIVMLGDAAVLPWLRERISPIGAVPVPGAVPEVGPPRTGLTIAVIRAALAEWEGDWPPTQPSLGQTTLGKEGRTIRLALHEAQTTWQAELDRAEEARAKR